MKHWVLCCAVLLAASPVAASESAWPRVAPRDFVFTALMPAKPTLETIEHSSFLGTTRTREYSADSESTRFSVSVTQIPRAAAWLAPLRVLFTHVRKTLLESAHAVEASFRETERRGIEGRELRFTATPPDERPRNGKAEIFVIQNQLVVIVASHPTGASDSAMERFFTSLDLDRNDCRSSAEAGSADTCHVDFPLD
jgi:hypothetical protein